MRSLTRVLVAAVLVSSPAFAQARPGATTSKPASTEPAATSDFETGPFYAGPRIWIGNLNGAVAIGGQVEKGFTKAGQYGPGIIGGGLGLDWYSWSFDYPFGGSYKYSVIPIQIFSNYHFVIANQRKLDPYVGLALVYSIVSASWSGGGVAATADGNTTDFAGQAGLRYFLKDNLALQGQIGFGYGTLGLGATWKF